MLKIEQDQLFSYILSSIEFLPVGHIHQDPLPGLVYAEGLPLFIDMIYHQAGHLIGIFSEAPLAESHTFKPFKE